MLLNKFKYDKFWRDQKQQQDDERKVTPQERWYVNKQHTLSIEIEGVSSGMEAEWSLMWVNFGRTNLDL